jgi:hypothetical protein
MNAKRPELSKSEAIRQAIARLENDYPRFKDKDYAPPVGGEELARYEDHTALKDRQYRENLAWMVRNLEKDYAQKDKLVDLALIRAGLEPTDTQISDEPAPEIRKTSIKVERGEVCEKVIFELKLLKTHIRNSGTNWTFSSLKRRFPSFLVLQILSEAPFDEEDRVLVCHPKRWVYPVSYGYGI